MISKILFHSEKSVNSTCAQRKQIFNKHIFSFSTSLFSTDRLVFVFIGTKSPEIENYQPMGAGKHYLEHSEYWLLVKTRKTMKWECYGSLHSSQRSVTNVKCGHIKIECGLNKWKRKAEEMCMDPQGPLEILYWGKQMRKTFPAMFAHILRICTHK